MFRITSIRYIVALFGATFIWLSGCTTTASNHHNFPNTAKVNQCENTFVLSGYGENIMLFEHEANNTKFELLRWYDDDNVGWDAFYDCHSNQLISFQESGYSMTITEGIRFIDLKDNHRTIVKTHEGFNNIVALYKNGFIYSTAQLKAKLFSIDTREVLDTYSLDMIGDSELVQDDLYVLTYDYTVPASDFIKLNLKTKQSTRIWRKEERQSADGNITFPGGKVTLTINGNYYILTASNSWDTLVNPNSKNSERVLKHFKKGALYQIKDQNLSYVTQFTLEDIVYANSPDKKHLYIFTKSRKMMKYDIENNTTVATYTIPVDIDPKYVLGTVGFTKDNFILTFQELGWARAYVVVANRDFSSISQPYYIEMAGINVTTQQSVQTNHDRVNNIE